MQSLLLRFGENHQPGHLRRRAGFLYRSAAESQRIADCLRSRESYSTRHGENVSRIVCAASPIFDQSGRIVAGLSVSGPVSRMETKLAHVLEEIRNLQWPCRECCHPELPPRMYCPLTGTLDFECGALFLLRLGRFEGPDDHRTARASATQKEGQGPKNLGQTNQSYCTPSQSADRRSPRPILFHYGALTALLTSNYFGCFATRRYGLMVL